MLVVKWVGGGPRVSVQCVNEDRLPGRDSDSPYQRLAPPCCHSLILYKFLTKCKTAKTYESNQKVIFHIQNHISQILYKQFRKPFAWKFLSNTKRGFDFQENIHWCLIHSNQFWKISLFFFFFFLNQNLLQISRMSTGNPKPMPRTFCLFQKTFPLILSLEARGFKSRSRRPGARSYMIYTRIYNEFNSMRMFTAFYHSLN